MATQAEIEHNAYQKALKQEVQNLLEKNAVEDWDGEGALPLSADTVTIAQELVELFPACLGRPDVSASPHGEIEFDWAGPNSGMFTVGVCPTREIGFAALFHDAHVSGSQLWDGRMPRFIEYCFERMGESMQTMTLEEPRLLARFALDRRHLTPAGKRRLFQPTRNLELSVFYIDSLAFEEVHGNIMGWPHDPPEQWLTSQRLANGATLVVLNPPVTADEYDPTVE